MLNGSVRSFSNGIDSKLGPHELLFHSTAHDRQLVARGGLHVPAADTQAAVADHQHDLGCRAARAARRSHPEAVAYGCQRSGVDELAGEAADESGSSIPRA